MTKCEKNLKFMKYWLDNLGVLSDPFKYMGILMQVILR